MDEWNCQLQNPLKTCHQSSSAYFICVDFVIQTFAFKTLGVNELHGMLSLKTKKKQQKIKNKIKIAFLIQRGLASLFFLHVLSPRLWLP